VQGQVLRIGALTTHSQIEASPLVAQHAPLLAQAAPHIAHRAIRNLGTLGGSVAHADPSAEWPACLIAAQATVVVQGAGGERRIAAGDFFVDLYTTALQAGEIVTAIELPLSGPDDVTDFDELARRHGDYAIVGLALTAQRAGQALRNPRLVFMGLGSTPVLIRQAAQLIAGKPLTSDLINTAVAALQAELQPMADLTHSVATKRHLAGVLARRALTRIAGATALA
jgi:carbon-monoxide dehydrogenase medium subunit